MDEARSGKAKLGFGFVAPNSAGLRLFSVGGLSFAFPDEFTNNPATVLGECNGCFDLRFWITHNAVGALDARSQLEQRRHLQTRT